MSISLKDHTLSMSWLHCHLAWAMEATGIAAVVAPGFNSSKTGNALEQRTTAWRAVPQRTALIGFRPLKNTAASITRRAV